MKIVTSEFSPVTPVTITILCPKYPINSYSTIKINIFIPNKENLTSDVTSNVTK